MKFTFDPTQSSDSDGDGYGDNIGGTRGDACPTVPAPPPRTGIGCIDSDGDGWSDAGRWISRTTSAWLTTDNDGIRRQRDAFPYDPSQLDSDW